MGGWNSFREFIATEDETPPTQVDIDTIIADKQTHTQAYQYNARRHTELHRLTHGYTDTRQTHIRTYRQAGQHAGTQTEMNTGRRRRKTQQTYTEVLFAHTDTCTQKTQSHCRYTENTPVHNCTTHEHKPWTHTHTPVRRPQRAFLPVS